MRKAADGAAAVLLPQLLQLPQPSEQEAAAVSLPASLSANLCQPNCLKLALIRIVTAARKVLGA